MGLGKTYSTKYLLDSNNSSGVAGQVLSTTATGIDWVNANTVPGAGLWIESGNNIYNSNSGNVGIGTTGPLGKLHVKDVGEIYTSLAGSDSAINFLETGGQPWRIGNRSADDSFRFSQSSGSLGTNVRVTFANGGNVGIGTTSPDSKLDVNGGAILGTGVSLRMRTNAVLNDSTEFRTGNTEFKMYSGRVSGSHQSFVFATGDNYTSGSTRMIILGTNGNIGIGTTAPGNKLSVIGTGRVFNATSTDDEVVASITRSGGALSTLGFNGTGSTSDYHVRIGASATNFVAYTSNTERMRILANGNVGIGLTAPTATLQIAGTTTYNSDTVQTLRVCDAGDISKGVHIGFDTTLNAGVIQAGDFGVSYRDLLLNPNAGNVGIGVTNPTSTLQVDGSSGATAEFRGATQSTVNFKANNANNYLVATTTGDFSFRPNGSISTTMLANGNVGIGTTSPVNKIQANYAPVAIASLTANSGTASTNWNRNAFLMGTGASISNALAFGVSGTANDRKAWIQSGHPDSSASSLGTISLNPLGGNVGIGNTNPSDYSADANNLVVGSLSGNNGITILSTSSSGYGSIYFADATTGNKVYSGFIRYQQNQSSMTFGTNEVERMRIDVNGNVGIGVTGPLSKLQIVANQSAANPGSKNFAGSAINADGGDIATGKIYLQGFQNSANDLCGFNNEADRVVLFNYTDSRYLQIWDHTGSSSIPNGSLGIGVTSPQAKVEIGSTSGAASGQYNSPSALLISTSAGSGSAGGTLLFGADGSSASDIQWSISNSNQDSNATGSIGNLNFNTKQTKAGTVLSPAMTILNTGNVGIGTTTPSSTLTLGNGTANVAELRVLRSNGISGTYAYVDTLGGTAQFGGTGDTRLRADGSSVITFNTNGADKMIILANGRVGIGTTTPAATFAVKNLAASFEVTTTNDECNILSFDRANTTYKSLVFRGSNLSFNPSDSGIMMDVTNGGVSIGTTTSVGGVKLNVDGNVLIKDSNGVADFYLGNYATANHFRFHTNNIDTYFDMNCGNLFWRDGGSTRYTFFPATANMTVNGTITQNSDVRVKENIVEIGDCISKVQAMRGVYYNRTDFNTEATKVGVIAQEVEAVLPELIVESPEDGLKSVAYSELTAVLINAIKEQQEIIEDLKTRVKQLENK